MFKYLTDILEGAWSLVAGGGVPGPYFFKKPVTVIYPKERIPMKRFKGPIAFVVDKKTDDHLCIACNACIKICPSRCMSLEIGKSAPPPVSSASSGPIASQSKETGGGGKRVLTDFKVNYMLCSLCSLCIDVCPTDALKHDDPNYDMVSLGQKELIMDLLEPFEKRGTPLTKIPLLAPGQTAPKPP